MSAARRSALWWPVAGGLALAAACGAGPARALDLDALWDFSNPARTEQRMRAALAEARGDDALILQTQIARTHGLRRDFDAARRVLDTIAAQLDGAGAEARVRHALELGRTHASATHTPAQLTEAARTAARTAYQRAIELARQAGLDALAVDALHMMAFVDTTPSEQLHWGRQALAAALASPQPGARRWEASLRNNIGHALNELGRHDEALVELRQAAQLREQRGNAAATRVAHWMVAHTLRRIGRHDEALDIQQRLARENDAAGTPDPYVFEELELLHRARGDEAGARTWAARRSSR